MKYNYDDFVNIISMKFNLCSNIYFIFSILCELLSIIVKLFFDKTNHRPPEFVCFFDQKTKKVDQC